MPEQEDKKKSLVTENASTEPSNELRDDQVTGISGGKSLCSKCGNPPEFCTCRDFLP